MPARPQRPNRPSPGQLPTGRGGRLNVLGAVGEAVAGSGKGDTNPNYIAPGSEGPLDQSGSNQPFTSPSFASRLFAPSHAKSLDQANIAAKLGQIGSLQSLEATKGAQAHQAEMVKQQA